MIYWKVAAVLFLISTVALSILQFSDIELIDTTSTNDVVGLENFYVQEINFKMKEYEMLANEGERNDLFRDFETMDLAYNLLKDSFAKIKNEEIANAMLENLRLRVWILNEQIQIMKSGKGREEAFHSS